MRTALAVLILLTPLVATAATVYKWVDERGVTHYSDQPHPGSEKVEVGVPQTYTAPPAPPPRAEPAAPTAAAENPTSYQRCELAQPVNDQVYFNVQTIGARLRTEPPLRDTDHATLVLDGRRMPEAGQRESFSVTPVYRGTHTFLAVVEDAQNRELCRTDAVTFHVRQPSVLAPNRATTAPRPRP